MKVKIDVDEWYPMYSIVDIAPLEIELTQEEITFIQKANEDFDKAQDIIRNKLYQSGD